MKGKQIVEDGIAKVIYSSKLECLSDTSKETQTFLKSTPCKKAKVSGEFIILRRSKRGMKYILISCSEYNIEFESGDAETMKDLSLAELKENFNPEIVDVKDMIEKCPDRQDLSLREIKKIYLKGISRARKIEYISEFNMANFYKEILPNFLQTNQCRTKVFITPNLGSKMGG